MPHFTQLQDINTGPVGHVALCPKRDVIALILGDGSLVIYRFSVANRTHERLYPSADSATNPQSDPTPTGPITALSWSPNGNTLALGYADGSLFLMDVESNYVRAAAIDVSSRGKTRHHSSITHLSWSSQYLNETEQSISNYTRKVSESTSSMYNRDIEFLLPSIRSCNDKRNNQASNPKSGGGAGGGGSTSASTNIGEISTNDIDSDMEGMLALVAADSNGMVSVSVGQGRYHVLSFHVSKFITSQKSTSKPPTSEKPQPAVAPVILGASMSPSLNSLTLLVSSSSSTTATLASGGARGGGGGGSDLRMIDVSTSVLALRRIELQLIARKVHICVNKNIGGDIFIWN
jgi:WD40 repeat protein